MQRCRSKDPKLSMFHSGVADSVKAEIQNQLYCILRKRLALDFEQCPTPELYNSYHLSLADYIPLLLGCITVVVASTYCWFHHSYQLHHHSCLCKNDVSHLCSTRFYHLHHYLLVILMLKPSLLVLSSELPHFSSASPCHRRARHWCPKSTCPALRPRKS